MKIRFTVSLFVLVYAHNFSQVGINTATPETTFEVVGKADDSSHFDGILPPRITGDQLEKKTYSFSKKGTILFITDIPSNLSGQVLNITEPGLYFFDGNQWQSSVNQKQTIEYQLFLKFDESNDDVLTEASKWSEPSNLSGQKNTYLTSSKFYTIGTKNSGALKGSITFKKIEGIVNIKLEISRETDSESITEDVTLDISEICDEIGYFPASVAFLHTENPTFLIPIYFQNKSIHIPTVNLSFITSSFVGELQGYSNWTKPHSR